MNIVRDQRERFTFFDGKGLVATLEKVPMGAAVSIEAIGKSRLQPLHSGDEVALRSLDHEMVVVAHDREGMQQPGGFLTGLEGGILGGQVSP